MVSRRAPGRLLAAHLDRFHEQDQQGDGWSMGMLEDGYLGVGSRMSRSHQKRIAAGCLAPRRISTGGKDRTAIDLVRSNMVQKEP